MNTRRMLTGLLGVLGVLLLLGMGGGGGGPVSDTIPRPKENHRADLVDRQGITTRVELLSCNGKTFLPLERGEGTLMVPFAKIERVTMDGEQGTRVAVRVEVVGGTRLEGFLPRTLLFTGTTDYGNYRIEARGLAEIRFVGGQG